MSITIHDITPPGGYADDYREFCGIWTAAEHAEFEASQEENAAVDPEDW